MSKNESVKASLDLYKGLIYLIITGIFAVCGFFANNYKTAEMTDLLLIISALIFLGIFLAFAFKKHHTKTKELKNLKERK